MSARGRIAASLFAADLRVGIALADQRKAENAARRARCRANAELVAYIENEARRRGLVRSVCALKCEDCVKAEREGLERAWVEYFRNIDINYP